MSAFPDTPDWSNLSVLHRNNLPPRANFKIYASESDALSSDESKAHVQCLAGTWKFHLANSPFEAPEGFEAAHFDKSQWSDIPVPSMWQLQGFGKGPVYTNAAFPIFVDPPHAPFDDNECGSYVTSFSIPEHFEDDQLRLRFEGVDSAYHVWVNGTPVGYHQGSRNPAEFDITDYVKRGGDNVLAVRVYQYCDGTYIEDQDQWRMSGIFRDVFLLGFPKATHCQDFSVQTIFDDAYENAKLEVQVEVEGKGTVSLKLYDADLKQVVEDTCTAGNADALKFSVPVSSPHKWTAETPYLYYLTLSLGDDQVVTHRVGFRQVELKDGLIKVNGKRIVIKGANRHEHRPVHGRTVSYEFMKQDLLLMKTHNINAIRSCHQPSDPRLYDLADEMGFWVMTIADAALSPAERDMPFFKRQQLTKKSAALWTSDSPEWHEAYVGRAVQHVYCDKLYPSVIMWSLCNEAFYGRNHVAMADWIRSYDPTRLIHYEPDLDAEVMDMHSRMYPYMETIVSFAEDASKTKPLVLCEFVHAMRTGPGNIKEYMDAFYKYPALQGGWIWGWANHGLFTKTKDGKEYYGYGGDFRDAPNDGNFVMDGVLVSDHKPNSGFVEYKKALEPRLALRLRAHKCLSTGLSALEKPEAQNEVRVSIEKTTSSVKVSGGRSVWTLGLSSGAISSWKKDNVELIAQPFLPSFFCAPTNNDFPQDGKDWLDRKLQFGSVHTRGIEFKENEDGTANITLSQKFGPKVLSWSLDLSTTLTFSSSGSLDLHVTGNPVGQAFPKTLRRIGVTLGLPAAFQTAEWYGRGQSESYRDMKLSQPVGLHTVSQISNLWAAPDFPQDCSNRTDTRWFRISNGEGAGLAVQFYKPSDKEQRHLFDFMASHYDVNDIFESKHRYKLEGKKKEHVIRRLDAEHQIEY
ncbi:hypothetical protein LTR22_026952 [Elasticomyces elasticus]|nr:hypothetical protein LTR22_026952 [Elasticomyces elasticus]